MSPSILLQISPESLANITGHLNARDFSSLRSTSKELCSKITHDFAREHLSSRKFHLAPHSLQGLVDLTGHQVFGPYVRKISFGTQRLDQYIGRPKNPDWMSEEGWSLRESFETLAQAHVLFVKTVRYRSLLGQAMQNLKKHNNKITIAFHDETGECSTLHGKKYAYDNSMYWSTGHGCEKDFGEFEDYQPWLSAGLSPVDDWTPRLGETMRDVLAAATKAKLTFKSFEFDLIARRSYPIFDHDMSFFQEKHLQVDKIISKLLFGRGIKLKSEFDICFKSRRDFRKELRIKTSAKRLEFKGTTDKGLPGLKETRFQGLSDDYGELHLRLKENAFCELRIEDCKVSLRTLCLFLWRHRETLHRVELSNITVDCDEGGSFHREDGLDINPGTKFTLFKCLKNELQLKHLEWSRVQFTSGWDEKIETFDDAQLTGKENISKALTELLSAETGNVVDDWKEDLYGWEEDPEWRESLDRDSLDSCIP
ncbi:hypothetical protein KCU67_g6504, partial [Aureobasidium melanogenum]